MSMYIGQMEKSVKVLTECSLRSWGRLKKATGSGQGVGLVPSLEPGWALWKLRPAEYGRSCVIRKTGSFHFLSLGARGTLSHPEPLCKKSDSPAGEAL